MNRNKIDLGKYDLNKVLRNPSLIHQIQDKLLALQGDNILQLSLREGAKNNIVDCMMTIIIGYKENPSMMLEVVDLETMKLIEEFSGETFLITIKH